MSRVEAGGLAVGATMAETAAHTTVAAIDIGSNAIRFIAADVLSRDAFRTLDAVRSPVRLGHDVFRTGRLSEDTIEAALAALREYRARVDAMGIRVIRAVATSAVREAENAASLVERAASEAGIQIDVINGAEEARLVHTAVRSRIPFGHERWLIADLGGGSVEISLADARGTIWSVSHRVGSVRLLEELGGDETDATTFRRRLEEYAGALTFPKLRGRRPVGFIATGGNIESLAKLAGAQPDDVGVAVLPLEQLNEWIDKLSGMTAAQRMDAFGLREDRADVILPAAVVYAWICETAGFDSILVPFVGLKDGLVLDLAHELHAELRAEEMDWSVYAGALALGRRFRYDALHARHVARLARSLFDQLAALHGLGNADRRILTAGALLHDVGVFISHRRHHKHSLYIITQSELPGLTPVEILMVANVARYHRRAEPSQAHEHFARLSTTDRARVVKLAAILRIADALDREHVQAVRSVRARLIDGKLELMLRATGDYELEAWAVRRKSGLFEKTFGLPVHLGDVKSVA